MLRKLLLVSVLCLLLGVMIVAPAPVVGNPLPTVDAEVWPTGDATIDPGAVQAAIDAASPGDVILLHAVNQGGTPTSFDFGMGGVIISKSLEIRGEMKKGKMTKILNGVNSLFVVGNPGADVTIRSIHLHNATSCSIFIVHAQDVTIIGNRITADTMKGRTTVLDGSVFVPKEPNENIGEGMWLYGGPAMGGSITGNVIVENNYVDLEEKLEQNLADPTFWGFAGKPDEYFKNWEVPQNDAVRDAWTNWTGRWCTAGIWVQEVQGNVRIAGNKVYNATMRGIMASCNTGDTVVEYNEIVQKLGGYFWGYPSGNVGIYAGSYPATWAPKSITVRYNKIVCQSVPYMPDRTKDSKDKDGIFVIDYGGVQVAEGTSLRGNDITLKDGRYGIWEVDGKGDYIGQNRIRGNGKTALYIGDDPTIADVALSPLPTEGISLVNNYVASFASSVANVIFWNDVINSTLKGNHRTIMFWQNNIITS